MTHRVSVEPLGSNPLAPSGGFITDGDVEWYRIDHYDTLDPFLVNVVTPSDQWMFASSSGALTAGRRSADHALFPYETDDRLHRNGGTVGPVTVIRVRSELWEPFARHVPFGTVRRSIAKPSDGTQLRFEEYHPGFGMTFRYTWATADRFGFVRTCELTCDEDREPILVEILDGLCDVLPSGVDIATQQVASTLVDAYRRAELAEPDIGVFSLEALVSDRPEPAESLRATVVWSRGLGAPVIALSDSQLRLFRSGGDVAPEHLVKGRKAGFFVVSPVAVDPGSTVTWVMVADVERTHGQLAELRSWLRSAPSPMDEVAGAVGAARRRLIDVVDTADGGQQTADRRATVHHFANVLFNVMRGGVFLNDHRVRVGDVVWFVRSRNAFVAERFVSAVSGLAPVVEIGELEAAVAGDGDLSRLVAEFLPLSFSRRHGDPSRPWNAFEISVSSSREGEKTGYQGNWRDIFQNWEALLHSFPGYIGSVIAKFLNASTVDGFNPYRINDGGIDWEIPEDGTWSNFGYWGDHQIAYLSRLLDASERFHPGILERQMGRIRHSYADVPYRIAPYERIVTDPKSTIGFDHARQEAIEARVAQMGADGRLVPDGRGGIHLASLAEKLLVPALSKLSNFVAGAGIWMNTQRPEWNDANNALVGNGVSVVTLFHLAGYIRQVEGLLARSNVSEVPIGQAVAEWIEALDRTYRTYQWIAVSDAIDPADRRALLDDLGAAFSRYRERAYEKGPGESTQISVELLRGLLGAVRPFLDQAKRLANRDDGLVEAYQLMRLDQGVAHVESLYPMLEGQVAALSERSPDDKGVAEFVDALFESPLYRPDQHSFLLYPDRQLPAFWDKNVVPDELLTTEVTRVLEGGLGVLSRDIDGRVHFDASLRSRRDLEQMLSDLEVHSAERSEILDLYERIFRHAAYTGRSGTMYRYEGLGSIYWHMVSKLLLAIQEHVHLGVDADHPHEAVADLVARYFRVRAGLGYMKDVSEQGTFPTDPHSHTPAHTGAQQPGMTGQVKEGVLLRWGELGVRVTQGRIRFRPVLLSADEFLAEPRPWPRLGAGALLETGTLGFTYCGVPVVYHLFDEEGTWSQVTWSDGRRPRSSGILDRETSAAVFARRGLIERIDVGIPVRWLR